MQWRQKKKKKTFRKHLAPFFFEQRYIQTAKGCKKRHNVSSSPGYVHLQFIYRLCWILTHIGILRCHPLIVKRTTWLGMGQCETDILHWVLGSNLALIVMSLKLNAVKSNQSWMVSLESVQYHLDMKDLLSSCLISSFWMTERFVNLFYKHKPLCLSETTPQTLKKTVWTFLRDSSCVKIQ